MGLFYCFLDAIVWLKVLWPLGRDLIQCQHLGMFWLVWHSFGIFGWLEYNRYDYDEYLQDFAVCMFSSLVAERWFLQSQIWRKKRNWPIFFHAYFFLLNRNLLSLGTHVGCLLLHSSPPLQYWLVVLTSHISSITEPGDSGPSAEEPLNNDRGGNPSTVCKAAINEETCPNPASGRL